MDKCCEWCESQEISIEKQSVFWELPDGTKAIEIKETPTVLCNSCGMAYQVEKTIKEIEDQLFLMDTKGIGKDISFEQLMEMPRLLKRNYFDF